MAAVSAAERKVATLEHELAEARRTLAQTRSQSEPSSTISASACTSTRSVSEAHGLLQAPIFFAGEHLQTIMRDHAPYGYSGEAERKILRYMANATQPARLRYSTCAVVGASGVLKKYRWGAEIDSHEAVIRANAAPVGGRHRPWTGSRSTWRVFSSAYWKGHYSHSGPHEQFLVVCDRPYVYSCQYHLFERHDLFPRAHAVNPVFYGLARQQVGVPTALIPTTGLLAVAAAVHACDRVRVYGFGNGSRSSCYYYHKDCHKTDYDYLHRKPAYHHFMKERETLARWHAAGMITWRLEPPAAAAADGVAAAAATETALASSCAPAAPDDILLDDGDKPRAKRLGKRQGRAKAAG